MFRINSGIVKRLLNAIDFTAESKRTVKERLSRAARNELGMDELNAIAGGRQPESFDSAQGGAQKKPAEKEI